MDIVKFRLLLTAVTMLFVSGCGKTVDNIEDSEGVMVRFNSQLEVHTRASGVAWANGDAVGIRMDNSAGAVVAGYANQKYTVNTAGELSPTTGQEMYYNLDGVNVRFIAYYPYNALLSDTSFSINISDQSDPTKIDYLHTATAVSYSKTTKTPVELAFKHKMSKMEIKTIAGTGITSLSGLTVKIKGMNTVAQFNTIDGVISDSGTPADIIVRSVKDGEHFEALLFPMSVDAKKVTIEFTLGAAVYTWDFPATTFLAGKRHTWNVTINR